MKRIILLGLLLFTIQMANAEFRLVKGGSLAVENKHLRTDMVDAAFIMLQGDLQRVLECKLTRVNQQADILLCLSDEVPPKWLSHSEKNWMVGKREAFILKVVEGSKLLVCGSDERGIAYGLLEISRMVGVSPWEWWADVTPEPRDEVVLPSHFIRKQSPSVDYRGIFINDEDWGLMPWSTQTFEPTTVKGRIGPKTYEKVFQLLLRLRANTLWPAMHECSEPFFLTPGNREMAKRYGIYMGASHCEPMGCNAAGEWSRRGEGEYDYVHNRERVFQFWEQRTKETAQQDMIYTIGMRGVHDGHMQGASTLAEQKTVLDTVFKDQRGLIRRYVNRHPETVPQVFIPYKEILDVYNSGLEVPDDVTLMWCDDNYGYIRHFPTAKEQARKGGNGVYYHVSYWGRPHDYLWLGTASPFLLFQQMKTAYQRGIRKMWILNVGDIKPLEYQTELFMDMAWNMDGVTASGVEAHMKTFLKREFGSEVGDSLTPYMKEHYRLAFIRKPEFMGNTRTEESDASWKKVKDLPWSETYIRQRMQEYHHLAEKVKDWGKKILPSRKDAFFQLVEYPVCAAAAMNEKFLSAQLARHGRSSFAASRQAFLKIKELTRRYNEGFSNQGKWNRMMDDSPRKLPVFDEVQESPMTDVPMAVEPITLARFNGQEDVERRSIPCEGLGYEGKAALLPKNRSVKYQVNSLPEENGTVRLAFLPTHPMDESGQLRFEVYGNGKRLGQAAFQTQGRSEQWKLNVLSNRVTIDFPMGKAEKGQPYRIEVKALDEGVILDQVYVLKALPHEVR